MLKKLIQSIFGAEEENVEKVELKSSNNTVSIINKSKFINRDQIAVAEVSKVYEELSEVQKNNSFAVFMFDGPNGTMNIQFSVENGTVGFDYTLLASGNIADEENFLRFAESKGFRLEKYEMNDVDYYRTDKGDLIRFCTETMTELYGLGSDEKIDFLIQY